MMTPQKMFKKLVSRAVSDLDSNAFAIEKKYSLPADAIRGIIRNKPNSRKEAGTSLNRAKDICDALGLEFYIGPPRDLNTATETKVAGKDFSTVVRYDAAIAAGGGYFNYDAEPTDYLAFSKKWLKANHINPANCILLNVEGHSMAPNIHDGDLIMLDRSRISIRKNKIYGFVDGDNGARVKRLEVSKDGEVLLLHSDNPDRDRFPTETRVKHDMNTILENIIGQVVWSGHKWE